MVFQPQKLNISDPTFYNPGAESLGFDDDYSYLFDPELGLAISSDEQGLHPVHQAMVVGFDSRFGPFFELVTPNCHHATICKYACVVDPREWDIIRGLGELPELGIGSLVNVSMKYTGYEPEEVNFPEDGLNGRVHNLRLLQKLTHKEHLLICSLAWADQPQAWETFEQAYQTGQILKARVVSYGFNSTTQKGGLIVQCGLLRGFVPGGQIDARAGFYGKTLEEILRSMVGQTIFVKVITCDFGARQLVFSETRGMIEKRQLEKGDFFSELEIGQRIPGFVTNIQPMGIFVRVGEFCDGLAKLENVEGSIPNLHEPVTVEILGVNFIKSHLHLKLIDTSPQVNLDELDGLDSELDIDLSSLGDLDLNLYSVEVDLDSLDEPEIDLAQLDQF